MEESSHCAKGQGDRRATHPEVNYDPLALLEMIERHTGATA